MSKVLYVDMDNVLVDFRSGIARLPEHVRAAHEDVSDAPGIFALMDPMPGAVEAFHELSGLFDTYILSTAPWRTRRPGQTSACGWSNIWDMRPTNA